MVTWLKAQLPPQTQSPWLAVDGFYAKREFLKPARRAGFVVVARLRKDAVLYDLPPVLPPGQKRPRGRGPCPGFGSLTVDDKTGYHSPSEPQKRVGECLVVR